MCQNIYSKKNSKITLLLFFSLSFFAGTNLHAKRYGGVQIIFETNPTMFPRYWRGGRIRGEAQPLPFHKRAEALTLIKAELQKYPRALLRPNLHKIYILNSLSFYGLSYGGTYHKDNRTIYMIRGGTKIYFRQLFHKNFSSILYIKYKSNFPTRSWKACNAPSFRYGKGGINALKTGASSIRFSTYYFRLGLLYQYATSSVEEDFNSFAGNIFTNKPQFWLALMRYKRLREKFILITNFYRSIHPSMTTQYFQKLAGQKIPILPDLDTAKGRYIDRDREIDLGDL